MKKPTDESGVVSAVNGLESQPAADRLQVQADWQSRATNAYAQTADDTGEVLGRELAAVTTVEVGGGASVYSFTGQVSYRLSEDGSAITVLEYAGRGVHIDGPDFGPVAYAKLGQWSAPLKPDRTFEIAGKLSWSDRENLEATLDIVLRATVLDNRELGFLSSTTLGAVRHPVFAGPVVVEVPAGW
jgi:hypothetical protein